METKPIYRLPELTDSQSWVCAAGCNHVRPMLFKNVYREIYSPEGDLLERDAEHYYTCQHGHLLEIWCESAGDYIELPDEAYKEYAEAELNISIDFVESMLTEIGRCAEKLNALGMKDINIGLEFNSVDSGNIGSYSLEHLNELKAALTDRNYRAQ